MRIQPGCRRPGRPGPTVGLPTALVQVEDLGRPVAVSRVLAAMANRYSGCAVGRRSHDVVLHRRGRDRPGEAEPGEAEPGEAEPGDAGGLVGAGLADEAQASNASARWSGRGRRRAGGPAGRPRHRQPDPVPGLTHAWYRSAEQEQLHGSHRPRPANVRARHRGPATRPAARSRPVVVDAEAVALPAFLMQWLMRKRPGWLVPAVHEVVVEDEPLPEEYPRPVVRPPGSL